ncbi:MAG: hypothetical protein P9F75_03220 [Candidatus Contendobacter sp.]|nr:hypothetical protein [Candidatus Contendobacter sp.]
MKWKSALGVNLQISKAKRWQGLLGFLSTQVEPGQIDPLGLHKQIISDLRGQGTHNPCSNRRDSVTRIIGM